MFQNMVIIEDKENNQVTLPEGLFDWFRENNKDKAIAMWNHKGYLTYLSKHFHKYTNLRAKRVVGEQWTTLFHDDTNKEIKEHFTKKSTRLTLDNVRMNNESICESVLDIFVDRLILNDETTYVCQLKNNTYICELERIVANSEKLVLAARLSAGLVHEIRNPLTSLKGFLQLVQLGVRQKEEYYQVMIEEIHKLEKITTELLQMAKPLTNQMQTEPLHKILDDISFMMRTQTSLKDVKLSIYCDEDILIICNAQQIKQILINLILNGAESMVDGGTISIHAYKSDQYIIIDVVDEGEGVTTEVMKELQEPFFTTKEQGTGLGLVITQHLLDLHHAKLKVKTNEHKGSTFTVLFPKSLSNN